ncbi:MAG: hypothetical protein E7326_02455 [Clostridiales bacterium]|nr:hypothetical protein [Clostridiales bacterium]
MYTEQDYQANRKQLTNRLIAAGIPAVLLLAVVIASFVIRIKWLTMLSTIILCVCGLFVYSMLLFPVIAYGRHLHDVLYGRTHTMTAAFKALEDNRVLRDGVEFYPVIVNVGRMDDEEDDRLLYFDANLSRPQWQIGDSLNFVIHDKSIGNWAYNC